MSGGTTELTFVEDGKITLLGGTKDISAGKAIDRIGVKLGISFPCGKHLDSIANDYESVKLDKLSVDGLSFNLSGLENKADKLIASGADRSYVAAYTIKTVCAVLDKLTENAIAIYGDLPILYAGGVMSNSYIKKTLTDKFCGLFAMPEFSCYNAAGIARLAALKHNKQI